MRSQPYRPGGRVITESLFDDFSERLKNPLLCSGIQGWDIVRNAEVLVQVTFVVLVEASLNSS
jgi:hypothetical protein